MEYQEVGQAEVQIVLTDIQVYAQANSQIILVNHVVSNSMSQILATYAVEGQAQASILAEYQVYSQAQVFAVYTLWEFGQAEAHILTTYSALAQAESQIIAFGVPAYGQAAVLWVERGENGEYIWPQYAQTQSLTVVNDIQVYGQALAWIAIQRFTYTFRDTFSRTTTAPPFNVGNADTGTPWVWNAWDDANPENVTPLYVDGSALVHGLYNGGQTYSSMHNEGATTGNQDAELTMDIWIATAGDNGAYTYWYDRNWYILTWSDTDSTYKLGGYNNTTGTIVPLNGRSAWYRLRVIISPTDPNHVKAHFWKIGDAEPATWVVVQTSWPIDGMGIGYIAPTFDIYETPYREPAKFDNIMVYTVGAFLYNQGQAQAFANIHLIPRNDTPAWGQANVFILQPGIDYYNYIIANDNPAAYYKLDDNQTNGVYGVLTDSIGSNTLTLYNAYSPYTSKINAVLGYGTVVNRNYAYNSLSPISSGNHGWAIEWWIQPNIFNRYNYNYIGNSYNSIYMGLASPDADAYTYKSHAPWWWTTPPQGTKAIFSYAYYTNGTWYATWVGSSALDASLWHHIVATVTEDQSTLNLYVNSVLVDTVNLSPLPNGWIGINPNHNFSQGNSTHTTAYDEYVIYNHELSELQVVNHYALATGGQLVNAKWAQTQVYAVYINTETGAVIDIKSAQAQTGIRIFDVNRYGQAQARISKGAGYGQARVRILVPSSSNPNSFRYKAYADGAVAYYGMNNQSDAAVLVDDLGSYNLTTGSMTKTIYSEREIIKPELSSLYWYSTSYHSIISSFSLTNEWSVEAWFKPNPNDTSMYSTVWSLVDGSNRGVILRYGTPTVATNSSGAQFFAVEKYGASTGATYSSGATYKSNLWHQLVITNKNGVRNLYVDGALQSSWSGPDYSWASFHINREPANSLYSQYDQLRDEHIVYNKELTANQVLDHYNAGIPSMRYAQAQVLINGLVFGNAAFFLFNPDPGAINTWNNRCWY
jgi:hypothetical protein